MANPYQILCLATRSKGLILPEKHHDPREAVLVGYYINPCPIMSTYRRLKIRR